MLGALLELNDLENKKPHKQYTKSELEEILNGLKQEKVEFKQYSEVDPSTFSVFFYIEVDNVDEKHKELISKGLTPATAPKDWPWGNREFVIKDPDGYKFVIYKKI